MELLDEAKFTAAMRICAKLPWIQKDRFYPGLHNLMNECKCDDHLWLIEDLLCRFNVVRSGDLDDYFHKMAGRIEHHWNLSPDKTIVSAIAEGPSTDGSQFVAKGLETALPRSWNGAVTNSINPVYRFDKHSIVLIDDFVGTGEKINKRISNIKIRSNEKSIPVDVFVLVVAGMKAGLQKIRDEVGDGNVFSCLEFSKAISDNMQEPLLRKAIDAMLELEGEFLPPAPFPKPPDYVSCHFGYGASEALFWIEGFNISNNVFPLFWWDNYYNRDYFIPRMRHQKPPAITKNRSRRTLFARR